LNDYDQSPPLGEDTQEAPSGEKRARNPLRIAIRVVVALVVIGLLVLPGVSTIVPAYYERYPDVRPAIENWERSTHARMSCESCHVEPGFVGHIEFGFQSIPAFYQQLLIGPSETNLLGPPSNDACLRCHSIGRKVSAGGDLRIPHQAHVVDPLNAECVQCHTDLVHTENPRGFNRPLMTECYAQCHDGEQAGQECLKCHTQKQVPEDHRRTDWLEMHREESDKQDCGGCHDWTPTDFCDECHKTRPRSHEGNFKSLHSARAARGSDGCLFCHPQEFCENCH